MKNILVTGGAGFIGSHLVDQLVRRKYRVTIFDNLDKQVHPKGLPDYLNLKTTFVRGDVRDRARFKDVVCAADAVVHFAAAVGVGQSQYQISHYVETNIQGTANLLDILANEKHHVKKVLVASSMSIYGEGLYRCGKCGKVKPNLRDLAVTIRTPHSALRTPGYWEPKCPCCRGELTPIPTTEDTPLMSNSIYAVTKKEQEEMTLLIGRTYGIPSAALRFFNVYGPRQSLSNPYTGVSAIFLSRAKNNNPPVVYEDGNQSRDFIWVEDIARACLLALTSEKANYQVFNVGSGRPVTIRGMAELIIRLLGRKLAPEVKYSFRKGDVRHCYADASRIKRVLGFAPKTSLASGLKRLIAWGKKAEAVDSFDRAARELKEKGLV